MGSVSQSFGCEVIDMKNDRIYFGHREEDEQGIWTEHFELRRVIRCFSNSEPNSLLCLGRIWILRQVITSS
jgi:hypothetical protein